MTGNFMYDPKSEKYFLIGTNKDQFLPLWWDHGEPLWVTAALKRKTSYMFFWPGCEVTIRGHDPTFCDAYSKVPTIQEVAEALDTGFNLINNATADMVAVYSEQPDYNGHKYGPDDDHTKMALQDIDREVGKLVDRIQNLEPNEKFNLIIFSDHGMTTIDTSRTINITDALTSEAGLYTTIMEGTALASVYAPNQEAEDRVYDLLKNFSEHMQVYRKGEIPDRFFYKNGPFVSRITCVADLGWTILQPLSPEFPKKGAGDMKGYHGYDNREVDMRGIFYAYGPYFKPGSRVDHIQAIDPYSVMCDVLDLRPAVNNGTLSVFEPLKATSPGRGNTVLPSVLNAWLSLVTCLLIGKSS
ncbi:ectonucleotide pyrophosphatase/phosphodiesterase family member 6 [Elysia marginata]|uniref:glycerophosphocholine cholinephosphodiesterase n=1 Tax=Elysia marginata TaxID=1093978 RepID=A0AAV4EZM5_9GAST|nr:ectonucleotide pyrophosphatase/phosphodiesterase family member 6 [Elysia marginata]